MNYSKKIALITFIIILAFFALVGVIAGKAFEGTFVLGVVIISLLVSVITYLFVSVYLHFLPKDTAIPQAPLQGQSPTTPPIPQVTRHTTKTIVVVVIIVMILGIIFVSKGTRTNVASNTEVKSESLPKFNIRIETPKKVDGLKGQASYDRISFDGNFYTVTAEGQKKHVYKLRDGDAVRITGFPDQFYALEFKPTQQGLVAIVWPTEATKVFYYLITGTSAARITNNYPPELSVDKVFGTGKIKVGLTDNDSEKKLYFMDRNALFDPIDIHTIKYPDIIVANDSVLTNTIIPQTYLVSGREFSARDGECGYKIYYINDQNPSLQEIQTTGNSKIENVCHYLVSDNTLWFTTRINETAALWKLDKKIATKITDIVLDDAKYYDNDTTGYNFKIAPSLETVDNLVMVNTGRNRYLVDGKKLKHIQNIAFGSISNSGQIIAHIGNYLFAGCADAKLTPDTLCRYDLTESTVQEKHLFTFDRISINPYKSLYDNEYYIAASTELASTRYYHLTLDKLTRVDKEVTAILYPNRYLEANHIDIVKKGVIARYQIPERYQFSEYEIGTDEGGVYYPASIKGGQSFDAIYYMPKD